MIYILLGIRTNPFPFSNPHKHRRLLRSPCSSRNLNRCYFCPCRQLESTLPPALEPDTRACPEYSARYGYILAGSLPPSDRAQLGVICRARWLGLSVWAVWLTGDFITTALIPNSEWGAGDGDEGEITCFFASEPPTAHPSFPSFGRRGCQQITQATYSLHYTSAVDARFLM